MPQPVDKRRKRKVGNSISPEITADDVKELWGKTKLRGKQPDMETNEQLATVMNGHRVQGEPTPPSMAALSAIRTLIQDERDDIVLLGSEAEEFRRLLLKLEPRVSAYHEASKNSWQPAAVCVIWAVAQGILEELGETGGTSRSSVAVKFTAAALKRMGWNGIDAPGIEALLKKAPRTSP